jgi:hypothetical protein
MGRPLDRMTCPTCGRQVAFRLIRPPRINRGRYGAIPGIRKPVRHKRWTNDPDHLGEQWSYCPAGEP